MGIKTKQTGFLRHMCRSCTSIKGILNGIDGIIDGVVDIWHDTYGD